MGGYESFWVLVVSKIIYAAMAAVQLTASAIYLSETLPQDKVSSHGFAVNFGICVGITITIAAGCLMDYQKER